VKAHLNSLSAQAEEMSVENSKDSEMARNPAIVSKWYQLKKIDHDYDWPDLLNRGADVAVGRGWHGTSEHIHGDS